MSPEDTGSIETGLELLTFIEFPDLNKGITSFHGILENTMCNGKIANM